MQRKVVKMSVFLNGASFSLVQLEAVKVERTTVWALFCCEYWFLRERMINRAQNVRYKQMQWINFCKIEWKDFQSPGVEVCAKDLRGLICNDIKMGLGCWRRAVPVIWDQTLLLMRGFTLVSSVPWEKLWSWFMAVAKREGSVTHPRSHGALSVWD